MRATYTEVLRNLVFCSIQRQTRLSEAQVARLRWSQIHGNVIRTTRQRECVISREVVDALSLLPHRESGVDYVFFGNNSLSDGNLESVKEKKKPLRQYLVYKLKNIA